MLAGGTNGSASASSRAHCTITGTPGNDRLVGTSGADVICGLGGNDVIYGLAGNDAIFGEAGNDKEYGGPGKDTLVGATGDDELYGGDGDDFLDDGRQVADVTIGGAGDDRVADGSALTRSSTWSVFMEPTYKLEKGTKVNWHYLGESSCIMDPLNDYTFTITGSDDDGRGHELFKLPLSDPTDYCFYRSSSGWWGVTLTTPAGAIRKFHMFVRTDISNPLLHVAIAECKYQGNTYCQGGESEPKYPPYGNPGVPAVIGPITGA